MTRYIDADALTDKVDKYIYRITRASKRQLKAGESAILADIKAHIELSPTIETEPVRHGKWIWKGEDGDSRWMCSECKCKEYVPTCNGVPDIWNYCPNCGCRMDKE